MVGNVSACFLEYALRNKFNMLLLKPGFYFVGS